MMHTSRVQAVLVLLVLIIALSCGAFAARSVLPMPNLPPSRELGGNSSLNLYGVKGKCDWVFSTVSIGRIAPQTGEMLNTVFDTSNFCLPVTTVLATDPKSKTAFMVGYYRYSIISSWEPMLSVMDFTNPDSPTERQRISLPPSTDVFVSYVYANAHYDPVGNNVWVIAEAVNSVDPLYDEKFLIKVDLTKGVAYNATEVPTMIGTYLSRGALNVNSRMLYLPVSIGMIGYNIDTLALKYYYSYTDVMSMAWDSKTNTTYALYARLNKGDIVTYGILEPTTGVLKDIKQYSREYTSAGTMVIDSSSGLSYVALLTEQRQDYVVLETKSGDIRSLTSAVPPDHAMNQYLFGL